MVFHKNYIIAAADITAQPKLLARYRGKTAKEVYRFTKGVVVTRKIIGPASFAIATIPKELSSGFIQSAIGEVGDYAITYFSGLGFLRGLYRCTNISYIKNTARLGYNLLGLIITLPSMGIGWMCDVVVISKLEEMWFGTPVYLFDDNRAWIEKNFTIETVFKAIDPNGGGE